MFPHDKLDWNLSRLDKRLHDGETEASVRLQFAAGCISKARFHGGGEALYHEALNAARRVLHHEPGQPEAVVLAALALVLLDRAEPAERYLEEARRTASEDPRLAMALGERALQRGELEEAAAAFERCVRLAGESWEAHLLLGRTLARLSRERESVPRRMEHAQYHLVRALQLGATQISASHHEHAAALYDLALLCLRTGRHGDAQRLFLRLVDFDDWRAEARYHLGRVASRMGKHKKAILYFRQHLEEAREERADVWARIGEAYLHEGDPVKAREACHRALALDAHDLEARWILGSALLEEGQPAEAVRALREILELAPDHHEAFAELVRLRTQDGDVRWLRQALRSETAVYDRLPTHAFRAQVSPQSRNKPQAVIDPRAATRGRIQVLLRGLGRVDPEVTTAALECLDLTTDEGLRFLLWESALDLLARRRAADLVTTLDHAGLRFGAAAGRDALALAHLLPEDALTRGLAISEDDLRKAAVDRHGPAADVTAHRQNIAAERQQARAWQSLLLLAIAGKKSPSARNLLVRWATDADPDLGTAARTGLAMAGDPDAVATLRQSLPDRQLEHLLKHATQAGTAHTGPEPATLFTDRDDLVCATCGRRGGQVGHMIAGKGVAVCNTCMSVVHERRAELTSRDPEVVCALTGATLLDAEAIYVFQGVPISSNAVDMSVGHDEREVIAAWLAAV